MKSKDNKKIRQNAFFKLKSKNHQLWRKNYKNRCACEISPRSRWVFKSKKKKHFQFFFISQKLFNTFDRIVLLVCGICCVRKLLMIQDLKDENLNFFRTVVFLGIFGAKMAFSIKSLENPSCFIILSCYNIFPSLFSFKYIVQQNFPADNRYFCTFLGNFDRFKK